MSRSNEERVSRVEPRTEAARQTRIRDLNDQFRTSLTGGRVLLTSGIRALGPIGIHHVVHAIRTFCAFDDGNDLYHEHDMGGVDLLGERVLWKIDYYDHRFEYGSPDPSLPALTGRVLTIMLASEY